MSEKNEVHRDGAKAQKNSGRGQYSKGDATLFNFLVDYKEASKQFGLSQSVWAKICSDTFTVDRKRRPLLKVILGEENKTRLAVIEWEYLVELAKFWADNHD